jgi:diacylglycerol kinase family enzyme
VLTIKAAALTMNGCQNPARQQRSSMDNVIISVNPKAGRTSPVQKAEELQFRLREKGFTVDLLTELDTVIEKANERHAAGDLRVLAGVGGDGTAATLVNRTQQGVPITLLAAGTANLLSKHYRLGSKPKRLADIIEHGKIKSFDAGVAANTISPSTKGAAVDKRIFLVMVSCGFDADVVSGVHRHREERFQQGHKKGAHISYFSYIKPIFHSLTGYKFPKFNIEILGATPQTYTARWAFIFNINRYGWGLPLAPFAKEADGKLDAVLFSGGTVFHGLGYTAAAQCLSMHRYLPSAILQQGVKFRLTASPVSGGTGIADCPVPFQLDGDPGGVLPLEIETAANRVTFLVP